MAAMETGTKEDRGRWGATIAIALLAAAAYANTLGNGFVWDDNTIVLGDPAIHSLANAPSFFQRGYWGEADPEYKLYRPVTTLSFAVDWAIGGGSPFPFHLTNLLLHVVATLLAFRLMLELSLAGPACWADLPWAFLGAALFAVHPVHTDAVDSIVQRAEVLAAIGVLGGFLAALHGRWVLLALAFAVGLFSKENAGVLPLLLAAWALLGPRDQQAGSARTSKLALPGRPRWPAYVVCAIVIAGYAYARWKALGAVTETHAAFGDAPLRARLLTMTAVFADYVRLILVPWPLCADFAVNVNPAVRVSRLSDPRFLAGAMAAIALSFFWLGQALRRRPAAFWGAWAAIALVPVSNLLVPIGAIEAERFLYLPSVGAFAGLASLLVRIRTRGVAFVVIALLASLTVIRNPVWKTHESLLDARMDDAPQNPFPYFYRATLYAQEGNFALALPLLDHALEEVPGFEKGRQLRARARGEVGDVSGAAEDLEALVAGHPGWANALASLARAYAAMGDREGVRRTLERLDRAGHPADVDLLFELDQLLERLRR